MFLFTNHISVSRDPRLVVVGLPGAIIIWWGGYEHNLIPYSSSSKANQNVGQIRALVSASVAQRVACMHELD